MHYFRTTLLIALGVLAFSSAAHAADPRVQGAKLCTAYIPSMERQYGIPSHLLSAISSTESGRYHKGLKIMLPWPWTINVEGKGYYFDSKAEAIAAVKQHQAAGRKSIDIGCMQVNLIHHGHAFSSLEKAFDPKYNVQYAASFLRRLYEEGKNWRSAAAAYHSKTPSRGSKYVSRVFRAWETIIARLRLPASKTIEQAHAEFDGHDLVKSAAKPVRLSRDMSTYQPKSTTASAEPEKHEAVKMKVIELASMPQNRRNDIILIKPDVARQSANDAYQKTTTQKTTAPNTTPITRVDSQSSKEKNKSDFSIVRLDGKKPHSEVRLVDASASSSASFHKTSGPRFIFTD